MIDDAKVGASVRPCYRASYTMIDVIAVLLVVGLIAFTTLSSSMQLLCTVQEAIGTVAPCRNHHVACSLWFVR